jgi:hypothetical protein
MGRNAIRCAAVVLAMAAGTAAPAVADPSPAVRHDGGCGYDTVASALLGDENDYRGVIFAKVEAFSLVAERNPVTVTGLRCELSVNGVVQVSVTGRAAGPLGVLEPTPIEFVLHDGDRVGSCTVLDTVDALGATASETYCSDIAPRCPPEGFCGYEWVLDAAFAAADEAFLAAFARIDPVVCPVLAQLAPYDDGVLRIEPGGDVYVAGLLIEDCPPYAG